MSKVKVPTKSVGDMVKEALTDEPQTSDQIHKRLQMVYGEANAPSYTTIQSTLSAKGTTLGLKAKEKSKVTYTRFPAGTSAPPPQPASAPPEQPAPASGKQPASASRKRKSPASGKQSMKADPRARLKAKKEKGAADSAEAQEAFQDKLETFLRRPLSAFELFGLAQRGVLKKQKNSAAVKEIVKVVGERWLLLSETERKKYEKMAEEDAERAARPPPPVFAEPAAQAPEAAPEAEQEAPPSESAVA